MGWRSWGPHLFPPEGMSICPDCQSNLSSIHNVHPSRVAPPYSALPTDVVP